jgi:hypothetical protein
MTNRYGNQCTGEAIDPGGEALICARHAAEVMRTVSAARGARANQAGSRRS